MQVLLCFWVSGCIDGGFRRIKVFTEIKGPDGALRGVWSKNKHTDTHTHTQFSLNDSLKYSVTKGQSPL